MISMPLPAIIDYAPSFNLTWTLGEYLTGGAAAPLRVTVLLVSTLPGSWTNKDPKHWHRRGTRALVNWQHASASVSDLFRAQFY